LVKTIHQQIIIDINSNLKYLNIQSKNYINDIIILIKNEIGLDKILSILLFGSQISGKQENTTISDCDLLIIFKNVVPNKKLRKVEKYFIMLEIKHGFREYNTSIFSRVLGVIQQTTGMFISHFLTKKHYWEDGIFHKIFQVNEVFAKLFAPTKIVLSSVIDNSEILHGYDLRPLVKKKGKIPPTDMIKSMMMNIIIAIFSIVITPFKNLKSIKYELEAVKWSLRASNYYSFKDTASLKTIIRRFLSFEKPLFRKRAERFYNKFLELRKNPRMDLRFIFRVPFRILKIHIKGFLNKNIRRNELCHLID